MTVDFDGTDYSPIKNDDCFYLDLILTSSNNQYSRQLHSAAALSYTSVLAYILLSGNIPDSLNPDPSGYDKKQRSHNQSATVAGCNEAGADQQGDQNLGPQFNPAGIHKGDCFVQRDGDIVVNSGNHTTRTKQFNMQSGATKGGHGTHTTGIVDIQTQNAGFYPFCEFCISAINAFKPSPFIAAMKYIKEVWDNDDALIIYNGNTLEGIRRIPMKKTSGKYNVWNKISYSWSMRIPERSATETTSVQVNTRRRYPVG